MTETLFSDNEVRALEIIVDMIIPASAEHELPSASDPVIFADILSAANAHHDLVTAALSALDRVAYDSQGRGFLAVDQGLGDAIVAAFRQAHPNEADLLATITVTCYYRDDRVMRSHGMEARAPHPAGFTVEEGDWSLLDPVRNRPEFYRKAT
jgi:hypothetical protein